VIRTPLESPELPLSNGAKIVEIGRTFAKIIKGEVGNPKDSRVKVAKRSPLNNYTILSPKLAKIYL